MIYNAAMVRRLFAKFQVNTYKTKKDKSAHAQLRQAIFIMRQGSGGYLRKCKSIHAKLKKTDVPMRSCAPGN